MSRMTIAAALTLFASAASSIALCRNANPVNQGILGTAIGRSQGRSRNGPSPVSRVKRLSRPFPCPGVSRQTRVINGSAHTHQSSVRLYEGGSPTAWRKADRTGSRTGQPVRRSYCDFAEPQDVDGSYGRHSGRASRNSPHVSFINGRDSQPSPDEAICRTARLRREADASSPLGGGGRKQRIGRLSHEPPNLI